MNRNASAVWRESRVASPGTSARNGAADCEPEYLACSLQGIVIDPAALIASALAGGFTTALARELTLAGLHVETIESSVTATVDGLAGDEVISHLQLDIRAKVPDSTQNQFVVAALTAKAKASVVRLLKTTISMNASLAVD